jgi:hypothetical protein
MALPVRTGNLPAEMSCIPVPAGPPQIVGMTTATPEDALVVELLSSLASVPVCGNPDKDRICTSITERNDPQPSDGLPPLPG